MTDEDKTLRARLQIDANEAVEQLRAISNSLGKVKGLIDEVSESDIRFNVQIKNESFNRVMKILDERLSSADKEVKSLSNSLKNLGTNNAIQSDLIAPLNQAGAAIKNLVNNLKSLPNDISSLMGKAFESVKSTSWVKQLKTSIKNAVSEGIQEGIVAGNTARRGRRSSTTGKIQRRPVEQIGVAAQQQYKQTMSLLREQRSEMKQILRNVETSVKALNAISTRIKNQTERVSREVNRKSIEVSKDAVQLTSGALVKGQVGDTLYRNLGAILGTDAFNNMSQEEAEKFLAHIFGARSYKNYTLSEILSAVSKTVGKEGVEGTLAEKLYDKRMQHEEELYQKELRIATRKYEYYDERFKRLAQQEAERAQFAEVWQRTKPYTSEQIKRYDPATQALMQFNQATKRIFGLMGLAMNGQRIPQNKFSEARQNLINRGYDINIEKIYDKLGLDELDNKIKDVSERNKKWNMILQNTSTALEAAMNIFNSMQQYANNITRTLTSLFRNLTSYFASIARNVSTSALDSYRKLEEARIGFANFFGEENVDALIERVKAEAVVTPGIEAADLADYIKQIAPLSDGNASLALSASLGMLKTIQYGGANGASEMGYVIRNVRDVMAKGRATQIDLNQFNRAMPVLARALESVGRTDMVSESGILKITPDNARDLMLAFAELNTSEQSIVKDIFSDVNKTLNGQIQQFQEQFITNWNTALEKTGVYDLSTRFLNILNEGGYITNAIAKIANYVDRVIMPWIEDHTVMLTNMAIEVHSAFQKINDAFAYGFNAIRDALGVSDWRGLIEKVTSGLAGLIKGFMDGFAKVIQMIDYIASKFGSSSFETILYYVGLLGSVFGRVLSLFGNFLKNADRFFKNIFDTLATTQLKNLQREAETIRALAQSINVHSISTVDARASAQADAIANIYKWRNENKAAGIITASSTVDTGQATVSAVQTLSQLVSQGTQQIVSAINASSSKVEMAIKNDNLTDGLTKKQIQELEASQRRWNNTSNAISGGAVPTVDAVKTGNGLLVYGIDSAGVPTVQTISKDGRVTTRGYSDAYDASGNLVKSGAVTAYEDFLSKANSMTPKFTKFINKVRDFGTKLMSGLTKAFSVLTLSTVVSSVISSMELFGDASDSIANIIQAAGITLSAAMIGQSFGGVTGGIVGALVGLGVAAVNLANTMKEAQDKLYNQRLEETMDERRQTVYSGILEVLKKNGLDTTTNAGTYATGWLLQKIIKTPVSSLSDTGVVEDLAKQTIDAYRWKQAGYKIEDYIRSNEFSSLYDASKDISTEANVDKEWRERAMKIIGDYALAHDSGYIYDSENRVYKRQVSVPTDTTGASLEEDDSERTTVYEEVSFQEVLEDLFGEGIDLSTNQVQALERFVNTAEGDLEEAITNRFNEALFSKGSTSWLEKICNEVEAIRTRLPKTGDINAENAELEYGISAEQYNAWKERNTGLTLGPDIGWTKDLFGFTGDESGAFDDFLRDKNRSGYQAWRALSPVDAAEAITDNMQQASDSGNEALYRDLATMLKDLRELDFNKISKEQWWGWVRGWQYLLKKRHGLTMDVGDYTYMASGGKASNVRGVDTVPAFLSPGEYVVKRSAVAKAGLGALEALNRGDFPSLVRGVSSKLGRTWNSTRSSVDNSQHNRSTKVVNNKINIFNRHPSGSLNTYYALANRLS